MIRRRNLARTVTKAARDPLYALQVGIRRLNAYAHYLLGRGSSCPPETVSLFLTYRCNLRCRMCGQWGEHGWARDLTDDDTGRHIPLERLESLIDELASSHPAITLFGGEPLLSPHWQAIVKRIKSHRLRVNIITNGTLLECHAREMIDLGVDELIFSLDGPEEIHDRMRSAVGTYNNAVSSFRMLNDLKCALNSRIPRVNVSTAIFEINQYHLEEVVAAAESFGADTVTLHHLIFQSNDTCNRHSEVMYRELGVADPNWRGFARDTLPDIDTDQLVRTLHTLRGRTSETAVTVYPNFTDDEIRRYYRSFDFVPESYARRCLSPWNTAYVFPDGAVKPCLDTDFVTGNVFDARFNDIWNGELFRQYRRALKRHGCFPACTRCTEFYRS